MRSLWESVGDLSCGSAVLILKPKVPGNKTENKEGDPATIFGVVREENDSRQGGHGQNPCPGGPIAP